MKDTRERCFGADMVASSAVGVSSPRTTVRISDMVEVGDVRYVEEQNKLGLLCCSRSVSSPGKNKERRVPVGPVVAKKENFLMNVRLLAFLHLKLLLERVLRNRV